VQDHETGHNISPILPNNQHTNANDEEHFTRNYEAFFRGYTPDGVKNKYTFAEHDKKTNKPFFKYDSKHHVVLDPLAGKPVVRYTSQPKRFEPPQVNTIHSEWGLKQSAHKFF